MRQIESRDIERLVDGDLSVVEVIRGAPQGAVRSAWEHSSQPTLTAAAVRRVLSDLAAGTAEPELVQQWASFIMRGYLEPIGPPTRPIDIEYEPDSEDPIIEAIAVLEQIGDTIDGEPSAEQLRQLIEDLSGSC